MDLFLQFSELPCATAEASFTAIPLSVQRKDFLAKAADGAPIFLLHDASQVHYSPSVQFKHLTAQFHATCRVHTADVDLQDQFAIVACDGSVPDLHELFVRCFGAAIEELAVNSGTRELSACVQKLLDLFKSLSQPSGKEVSGLWGELYVIAKSGNVAGALAAWHSDPFDRFDFSWGQECLEVKASTHSARLHHFALEQLMEPTHGKGYVVSVLMQPLSGGFGLLDLANSIESDIRLAPALKQKLWGNMAKALGNDFSDKLDKRFDPAYAERNLAVYLMQDIPKPAIPSDPRVMNLRFTSDLTNVTSSLSRPFSNHLRKVFEHLS
jgi:hypothetical protein